MELVALNGSVAYFADSKEAAKFNPFGYINDLLSIRTPRNLVEFLRDYPIGAYKALKVDKTTPASNAFAFSEDRIAHTADSLGIVYLDNFQTETDSYTSMSSALLKWADAADAGIKDATVENANIYELPIEFLAAMQQKLWRLLSLAAAAQGLDYELTHIKTATHNQKARATLPLETLLVALPKTAEIDDIDLQIPLRLIPGWRIKQNKKSLSVSDYLGFDFNSKKPNNENDAACVAAGFATTIALESWLQFLNPPEKFSYKPHIGIVSEGTVQGIPIAEELKSIVLDGRLGICRYCGLPFVTKKKADIKTFCCDSCKVKDHNERRKDG